MQKSINVTLQGIARNIYQHQLMDREKLSAAIHNVNAGKCSLISYIVQNQLITPIKLAYILAKDYGLPLLDLNAFDTKCFPTDILDIIRTQHYHFLPLLKLQNILYLAISDPTENTFLEQIKFKTGLTIQCVVVEEDKLSKLINKIFNPHQESLTQIANTLLKNIDSNEDYLGKNEAFDIKMTDNDEAPIIRFVNKILVTAIHQKASDIHFEMYENIYRIRYRLDGLVYVVNQAPLHLASRISTRLKIMAKLDISERRIPQDGRFKLNLANSNGIDFRISTCPTVYGEKIVARIFDSNHTLINIDALGFEPSQKQCVIQHIQYPHGMILVTGPTGSGKTLTLYTLLNILNTPQVNISTIEDPVEIYLKGINQVNINSKTQLTFAKALRTFLRQDPDVIMVGEMRDLETAEIAIKAAQTGHLVLSTLHTNSATETLTRLVNMGVAAHNVVASISVIIAQRLLRKLCHLCKQDFICNDFPLDGFTSNYKIYRAIGCQECNQGYKGRIGIFEILPLTDAIKQIILQGGNPLDLAKQAIQEGMLTLRNAAFLKVKQGLTSLDEVTQVVRIC